jgi:hypothetical protein
MNGGPEFFQTRMGQKYYDYQLPQQIQAMNRLAAAIEKQNELKEKEIQDLEERNALLKNHFEENDK